MIQNQRWLLWLGLFIASWALVSCGNNSEEPNTDSSASEPNTSISTNQTSQTSTPTPTRDTDGLQLNLSEGQTFRMKFETSEDLSDSPMATTSSDLEIRKDYLFEVVDIDRSGNYKLQGQIEAISFTSDEAVTAMDADFFNLVAGETFDVWVSPMGEIQEVEGFDAMFDHFMEAMKEDPEFASIFEDAGVPDSGSDELGEAYADLADSFVTIIFKPIFDLFVGEQTTRTMLNMMFAPYHADTVSVGATWVDSDIVSQSFGISFPTNNNWAFTESTADVDKISVKFEFDPNEHANMLDFGLGQVQYTGLTGSGEATYELDPTSGWPKRLLVRHAFSGKMESAGLESYEDLSEDISGTVEVNIELLP